MSEALYKTQEKLRIAIKALEEIKALPTNPLSDCLCRDVEAVDIATEALSDIDLDYSWMDKINEKHVYGE